MPLPYYLRSPEASMLHNMLARFTTALHLQSGSAASSLPLLQHAVKQHATGQGAKIPESCQPGAGSHWQHAHLDNEQHGGIADVASTCSSSTASTSTSTSRSGTSTSTVRPSAWHAWRHMQTWSQDVRHMPPVAGLGGLNHISTHHPLLKLPCAGSRRPADALSRQQNVRHFFSFPTSNGLMDQFRDPDRAATNGAILANIFTYALTSTNRRLFTSFVQMNHLVLQGEWWRLLTAPFLHGGLLHLGANMLAIHMLGPPLEHVVGRTMFWATYMGGALGGGLAHLYLTSGGTFVLGSSGAIAGLFAGFVTYKLRNRDTVGFTQADGQWVGQMVLLNLMLAFMMSGTLAHMAHIGGVVGGCVSMFLLGPRFVWENGRVVDRPLMPLFRGWP